MIKRGSRFRGQVRETKKGQPGSMPGIGVDGTWRWPVNERTALHSACDFVVLVSGYSRI